ncbi:MAG: hypothetical protein AAF502_02475 [Bacteroidota bacterium]
MLRIIFTLGCFIFLTTFAFAQSAWTQPKGGGFAQLGLTSIPKYSSIYTQDGESFNTSREISDKTIQLYGEYGIRDKTTIILAVPLKIVQAGDSSDVADLPISIQDGTLFGFGNIEIGVRQKLYSGKFELSVQVKGELGTGSFDQPTGLRTGFDTWGLQSLISIGTGIDDGYVFGYVGGGFRTGSYSSYFKTGLEGGYTFFDRVTLAVFLDVLTSFKDGNRFDPIQNIETGLYLNDQQYVAYGFKVLGQITDLIGVSAAFGGAASGNLVPRSPSLNLGVYAKWE